MEQLVEVWKKDSPRKIAHVLVSYGFRVVDLWAQYVLEPSNGEREGDLSGKVPVRNAAGEYHIVGFLVLWKTVGSTRRNTGFVISIVWSIRY